MSETQEIFGNRQKQSLFLFAAIVLGLIFVSLRDSAPDSPEGIVEGAVLELIAAAEKGDTDPFKKWLSEEVKDTQGRDKQEIVKTLFGIFFRFRNIKLTQVALNVGKGTNPNLITVQLSLLMGSDTPLPTDKGDFQLTFRNENGSWRIWEINWEDGAQYG